MPNSLTKKDSSFRGDVLRLMSGSSIAQIITIFAAPILSRLYPPEAYGLVAIYGSIVGIMGVLACFRYEMTIVLPKSDRESANLLMLSILSALAMGVLTSLVLLLVGDKIVSALDVPQLIPFLWLVPIAVILGGFGSALNYWNTRTKHFQRLSTNRVISQTVITGGNLGAGLLGRASGGAMIIVGFVGQAVSTGLLAYQVVAEHGRFIWRNTSIRKVITGLRRYKRFPLISSWGALINTASWQLPVLLLGTFFSPVIVGFYALGHRIIQLPLGIIGGALSQVFFQYGADSKNKDRLQEIVADVFRKVIIFGLLPTIVLTLTGADLFAVVFGERWREAGLYSQILAPWALLWFMSSPLSTIYIILERQRDELKMHSLIFLTRVIGIVVGGLYGDPVLAISLFAIGGVASYGYLLNTIMHYTDNTVIGLLKSYIQYIVKSLVIAIPLLLTSLLNAGQYLILTLSVVILTSYYIWIKSDIKNL